MKSKSQAKAILQNYHALKERRYVGDLSASDTLIDFEKALELANLTKRQREALHYVYIEDLTQKSAGERMGITQPSVVEYVNAAEEKLDDVYEYWAWLSGELSPADFEEDEMEVAV